jgi:transcriptional regulator with XRE-family HTH domain
MGGSAEDEWGMPPLPAKLRGGNYPAVEYARAVTARDLIRSRRRLGLSQTELARRAGVRVETLNRIERAKMTASVRVMEKLDAVLSDLGRAGGEELKDSRTKTINQRRVSESPPYLFRSHLAAASPTR